MQCETFHGRTEGLEVSEGDVKTHEAGTDVQENKEGTGHVQDGTLSP